MAGRWDVTQLLGIHNQLQVQLQLEREPADERSPPDDRPVGHFWLEITSVR
jgi:hypothetical protein